MIDMRDDNRSPARTMNERQAQRALRDAHIGVMHSAFWIAELVDRKGWKVLGWNTAEEFADGELGLGRSSLYRVLDQGRMLRRLSGGDLKRLGSYALSQRFAETLKQAPDEVLDMAGERIAGGEEVGEVVADILASLNSQPEVDALSRARDTRGPLTSRNAKKATRTTGEESEAGAGTDKPGDEPSGGLLPTEPKPPETTGDDGPSGGAKPKPTPPEVVAAKAEDKAAMGAVRELLRLGPDVLARAAKRSVLAELEGILKQAQKADRDGAVLVLLDAKNVKGLQKAPHEPDDAGYNRCIRDLLSATANPAAPTPGASLKKRGQPAAARTVPAPAAPKPARKPKKGEPCPHPIEAHTGAEMSKVTCSWCGEAALTHVSLVRMGERAMAAAR